ncbi:MAG: alpha/beta fold hydrolase [Gemmatimonadaceae bacterium]|nr:alpha/beta fold hydrolase [Gemmatimonadaceae bacterium]
MDSTITLKDRERDILLMMARGATDRMIASRLNLSEQTVRWYNKQCYTRLGVGSRQAAVARAVSLGLISVPDVAAATPAVARSPIRYVSNDGVSIAYQVVGNGPVDVLFMSGFVSHLEMWWEEPECAAFLDALGREARVILFDKRGVGLSDRHRGVSTIEETISDAQGVLHAVQSTRMFVCGTSESGALAILLASMHPDSVRGLILIGTTPMTARLGDEPEWAVAADVFAQRIAMIEARWGEPWALERFAPSRLGNAAFEAWWSRALRSAASPGSAALILQRAAQVDVRSLLHHVHAPTLILHRTDDGIVNVGGARFLASHMPNARLVELAGADHLFFVDGAPVVREIARFLAVPDATVQVDVRVAIILCEHGAGSRLDDAKRRLLRACEATVVTAKGEGWFALFDAPNRAIRCAQSLTALGADRVGGLALHVGATRLSDDLSAGSAPSVARHLAASAQPGQVLVTATLRDILAGSPVSLVACSIADGEDGAPPMTVWQLAS